MTHPPQTVEAQKGRTNPVCAGRIASCKNCEICGKPVKSRARRAAGRQPSERSCFVLRSRPQVGDQQLGGLTPSRSPAQSDRLPGPVQQTARPSPTDCPAQSDRLPGPVGQSAQPTLLMRICQRGGLRGVLDRDRQSQCFSAGVFDDDFPTCRTSGRLRRERQSRWTSNREGITNRDPAVTRGGRPRSGRGRPRRRRRVGDRRDSRRRLGRCL